MSDVIESTTDVVITFETSAPKGADGADGIDAASAIPGSVTGDFLRWNETDNAWEVKSEPIEFNQIVLTPSVAAALNREGGLWYDSVGKSVMVCTDI
jgi:hypothetical protein